MDVFCLDQAHMKIFVIYFAVTCEFAAQRALVHQLQNSRNSSILHFLKFQSTHKNLAKFSSCERGSKGLTCDRPGRNEIVFTSCVVCHHGLKLGPNSAGERLFPSYSFSDRKKSHGQSDVL